MPDFSVAISSTVSPRYSVWSSPIGVMTHTLPSATFVASHAPPMPTSTMATSTGASANAANAIAVITSKKDRATPPSASDRASTKSTYGLMSLQVRANLAGEMGWPSKQIRSRASSRWGEVNRPVRRPNWRRSDSMTRAVVVLPFVPVTWMTGYVRWGSPRSSTTDAMRTSEGSIICSGQRAVSSFTRAACRCCSSRAWASVTSSV